MVFSVDGLEDTNHLYRRNVKWQNVYNNMCAYSESGATGIWEYLLFEHNKHQVDEARAMAESLNLQFIIKQPVGPGANGAIVYDSNGDPDYTLYAVNINSVKNNNSAPAAPVSSISHCRSIAEHVNEFYIAASGQVVPCCFLGGALYSGSATESKRQFYDLNKKYDMDNFNIKDMSVYEILSSSEFINFFVDNWKKNNILLCNEVCGRPFFMDWVYKDN